MVAEKMLQGLRLENHGNHRQIQAPPMLGQAFYHLPMAQVQTIKITDGQHTAICKRLPMI